MGCPDSAMLFAALADELDRTRADVDGLATLVAALVRVCPPAQRSAALVDAQVVDALGQHLQVLAGFARDLSIGRSILAATEAVTLSEVASRLLAATGVMGVASAEPAFSGRGDLELFD